MHDAKDSIKEGYEVTDMNVRIITFFLIGLFVLMFGAAGTILIVMRGFDESRAALNTEVASPLANASQQIPAEPHLQMFPVNDRIAINKANDTQVNSYGQVSSDQGMERVHIPVDRAMALVAEGKAPYRQQPVAAQLPASEQ